MGCALHVWHAWSEDHAWQGVLGRHGYACAEWRKLRSSYSRQAEQAGQTRYTPPPLLLLEIAGTMQNTQSGHEDFMQARLLQASVLDASLPAFMCYSQDRLYSMRAHRLHSAQDCIHGAGSRQGKDSSKRQKVAAGQAGLAGNGRTGSPEVSHCTEQSMTCPERWHACLLFLHAEVCKDWQGLCPEARIESLC